jgi:hypothetical protein
VHCSRVFRSSAPSDLLPSSPCGCPSGTAQGECGSTRSMEWGVGPGGGVPHRRCCPAGKSPARHTPEGTLPGPVRSQGRVARCVIQNWSHVLSAPRRAWNLHGNNDARCMDSRSRPDSRSSATSATRSRSPGVSPGSSSGSTPTRPGTSPSFSTATNAHSADSRSRRSRPYRSKHCRNKYSCRRSRSNRSRFSRVRCSQVRFSRSS